MALIKLINPKLIEGKHMLMMNATRKVQNKANIQSKTIQIETSDVISVFLCGFRTANIEMFPYQIDVLCTIPRSLVRIVPIPQTDYNHDLVLSKFVFCFVGWLV